MKPTTESQVPILGWQSGVLRLCEEQAPASSSYSYKHIWYLVQSKTQNKSAYLAANFQHRVQS